MIFPILIGKKMVHPGLLKLLPVILRHGAWLISRVTGAVVTNKLHGKEVPKVLTTLTSVGIAGLSIVSFDFFHYARTRHEHQLKTELEKVTQERDQLKDEVKRYKTMSDSQC